MEYGTPTAEVSAENAGPEEPTVQIRRLRKWFVRGDHRTLAIDSIDLDLSPGSFVALVGPSGCGKSTILNIVSGLMPPSGGRVRVAGDVVRGPMTTTGYMTQRDTLMPWRDLVANIAMPLELQGVSKNERRSRALDLLQSVGLTDAVHKYPRELSGGMARRACLARLLCADPDVLLLDEPFGALDAQLRLQLQNLLLTIWNDSHKCVLFVTHDIEEAVAIADRVIVLTSPGAILYDEPISLPRPRDAMEIRFNPEFQRIQKRLWTMVMDARSQGNRHADSRDPEGLDAPDTD